MCPSSAATDIRVITESQARHRDPPSRWDVTVFPLNARPQPKTGSEPAFRRNTAERVYITEAAHNPEVAGSNPAPATAKGAGNGAFRFRWAS
jgi:hypothetical protein